MERDSLTSVTGEKQTDFMGFIMDLVKSTETLKEKRTALMEEIGEEERIREEIEAEILSLQLDLERINDSLARKWQAKKDFDRTIAKTEAAYMRIMESSQSLLHVLNRETNTICTKRDGDINDREAVLKYEAQAEKRKHLYERILKQKEDATTSGEIEVGEHQGKEQSDAPSTSRPSHPPNLPAGRFSRSGPGNGSSPSVESRARSKPLV